MKISEFFLSFNSVTKQFPQTLQKVSCLQKDHEEKTTLEEHQAAISTIFLIHILGKNKTQAKFVSLCKGVYESWRTQK